MLNLFGCFFAQEDKSSVPLYLENFVEQPTKFFDLIRK
jgi:hypothetical protein